MSIDFDDDTRRDEEVEVIEEEETRGRPNLLRVILLVLLVLILLCVVCFLATRTLGIALPIPGFGGAPPPPVEPTTEPAPTDETGQLPPEETTEPVPGTEEVPTEEAPATDEAPATGEPAPEVTDELPPEATEEPAPGDGTEEPVPGETEEPMPGETEEPGVTPEPTDELIDEHDEEPIITPPATTEPNCDNNALPTAQADAQPDPAMMGKGQAFVTFDGTGSVDPDGTIIKYEWDFGDGSSPQTGESVVYGYTSTGMFTATLTITDNCNATSEDMVKVTIVGPTPPTSNGNGTPTATATPTDASMGSGSATMGFCYRVQRGDTLSGIAQYYGISLRELASVNNISPYYYVVAGEPIFVPSGAVKKGPNGYEAQSGDTLNSIAYQCGLTVTRLAQVNNLNTSAALAPGQLVMVPLWR